MLAERCLVVAEDTEGVVLAPIVGDAVNAAEQFRATRLDIGRTIFLYAPSRQYALKFDEPDAGPAP